MSRLGYTGDVRETAELKKLDQNLVKNPDLTRTRVIARLSTPSGEEAEEH